MPVNRHFANVAISVMTDVRIEAFISYAVGGKWAFCTDFGNGNFVNATLRGSPREFWY